MAKRASSAGTWADVAVGEPQRQKRRRRQTPEAHKVGDQMSGGRSLPKWRKKEMGSRRPDAQVGSAAFTFLSRRNRKDDLLEYLRTCGAQLRDASGAGDDGGSVTVTDEMRALASAALVEVGDRMGSVAIHQRGSKLLEKILRLASPEAFGGALQAMCPLMEDLAVNQYASHVLEVLWSSWAERMSSDTKPPVEPVLALCRSLEEQSRGKENSNLQLLLHDPCGTHALRFLLLVLGGFAPDARGLGRAIVRAGRAPERRFEVPEEVSSCRRSLARRIIGMLLWDESLCSGCHASPAVQILLRVLHACEDKELVASAIAAALGQKTSSALPTARCEALATSAPGSRTLEAILETASDACFVELYTAFFKSRLCSLASGREGEFGVYIAQQVLDRLRDSRHLAPLVKKVDMGSLLGPGTTGAHHAFVAKLLEACLRVDRGPGLRISKRCVGKVFRALGLDEPGTHRIAWRNLLALKHAAEGPAELLYSNQALNDGGASSEPVLRRLSAGGPLLVSTLLLFQAELLRPLTEGLASFVANRMELKVLALERRTARVLELALSPSSGLLDEQRLALASGFRGLIGTLGPHAIGGWVCTAVWAASSGATKLREQLAAELLAVEDKLRSQNVAVWKACGLHRAKAQPDEWRASQKKQGKAKRLLSEVVGDQHQHQQPSGAAGAHSGRRKRGRGRA